MALITSEHADLRTLPRPVAEADRARLARERELDAQRARRGATSSQARVGRVIADLGIDPDARGIAPLQERDEHPASGTGDLSARVGDCVRARQRPLRCEDHHTA